MRYLNLEETIWFDADRNEIVINEEKGVKAVSLGEAIEDKIFRCLIEKEGEWIPVVDIEEYIGCGYCDFKQYVLKLINKLNDKGILCENPKSKPVMDFDRIYICNKAKIRNDDTDKGSYKIILPKVLNKTEKIISGLYWEKYDELSRQKMGEKRNDLSGKLADLYKKPIFTDRRCNEHEINIDEDISNRRNGVITAPNGYGKTAFMKSMLLSILYPYVEAVSEEEKNTFAELRQSYGLKNYSDYFCIFFECKDLLTEEEIDFEKADFPEWVYKSLSETITLNRHISLDEYKSVIREYNLKRRLIVLIDGLDETDATTRKMLLAKVRDFQGDSEYGCNGVVYLTTRPLFFEMDFKGYYTINIKKINPFDSETWVRDYIKRYSLLTTIRNSGLFDTNSKNEELVENLILNSYIKELMCTPAVITCIVGEYLQDNDVCVMTEDIVREMMLRFKYDELIVSLVQYERIYEEIAYYFITSAGNELQLNYGRAEIFSMIRSCIDNIIKSGDTRFARVFGEDMKSDEVLGDLFFTNVALLEYVDGALQFSTALYVYHLCAIKLIRTIREKIDSGSIAEIKAWLDMIPFTHRYHVIAFASAIAMHLTDMRFNNCNFGFEAPLDAPLDIRNILADYILSRWEDNACSDEERMAIQNALARIKLNVCGNNVFTNCNIAEEGDEDIIAKVFDCLNVNLGNEDPDYIRCGRV